MSVHGRSPNPIVLTHPSFVLLLFSSCNPSVSSWSRNNLLSLTSSIPLIPQPGLSPTLLFMHLYFAFCHHPLADLLHPASLSYLSYPSWLTACINITLHPSSLLFLFTSPLCLVHLPFLCTVPCHLFYGQHKLYFLSCLFNITFYSFSSPFLYIFLY